MSTLQEDFREEFLKTLEHIDHIEKTVHDNTAKQGFSFVDEHKLLYADYLRELGGSALKPASPRRPPASRLLLVLAIMVSACAPRGLVAVPRTGTPPPAPDMATIIVFQPNTRFQAVSIVDAQGRLLGQLNEQSQTAIRISPGPIRLYAIPERMAEWSDRIDGTVLAGKTYYATIGLRYGGLKFLALNPRSRDNRWSALQEYLSTLPAVQMDPALAAQEQHELSGIDDLIPHAESFPRTLNDEHRSQRLFLPEDGL